MPQVGPAVPERDLGLKHLVRLSQPGSLELSQGSQGGGEIIVQGDVCWSDRMRLQEARRRWPPCLFPQPTGPCCARTAGGSGFQNQGSAPPQAVPGPSGALTLLALTAHRGMRSRLTIAQAGAAEH